MRRVAGVRLLVAYSPDARAAGPGFIVSNTTMDHVFENLESQQHMGETVRGVPLDPSPYPPLPPTLPPPTPLPRPLPPPPLRCNLGVYPLQAYRNTDTQESLFLQAHCCSQYSARTLSNRHRYMQVIRETVNAPGCVTSVFQPGTNLKTRKLHSRGVGSLYSLLSPKRIKSGVIKLQCDLRELYFSNLEAAVTKQT